MYLRQPLPVARRKLGRIRPAPRPYRAETGQVFLDWSILELCGRLAMRSRELRAGPAFSAAALYLQVAGMIGRFIAECPNVDLRAMFQGIGAQHQG